MQDKHHAALTIVAAITGIEEILLHQAWDAVGSHHQGGYRTWFKKKRNNPAKRRLICAPIPELKLVQDGIKVWLEAQSVPSYFFGSVPKRSVIQNAQHHIVRVDQQQGNYKWQTKEAPRWVLAIDLKDAYPSVRADLLRTMFRKYFKLETLSAEMVKEGADLESVRKTCIEILVTLTTYQGKLPQGAPSSSILLNLALVYTGIAERLRNLCLPFKRDENGVVVCGYGGRDVPFTFSIYVDDITISSWKLQPSARFIHKVISVIEEDGHFTVNREKIRLNHRRHGAQRITGVSLTEITHKVKIVRLTINQKDARRWRGIIHRAKCSLETAMENQDYCDPKLLEQALGITAWITSVCTNKPPASVCKVITDFNQTYRLYQLYLNRRKTLVDQELRKWLVGFSRRIQEQKNNQSS
jgi:hypothetical protein